MIKRKPSHPDCPNCYAEQAGVLTYCDYHAIAYLGQNGKLPEYEQAAFDRICKERQIALADTTPLESRALNKFVKAGLVKKNGLTTYELP